MNRKHGKLLAFAIAAVSGLALGVDVANGDWVSAIGSGATVVAAGFLWIVWDRQAELLDRTKQLQSRLDYLRRARVEAVEAVEEDRE